MRTLTDLIFYEPARIVVADVDNVRWFSDSHLLVPLRCNVNELLESRVGDWRLESDEYGPSEYTRTGDDLGTSILDKLSKDVLPRNVDRQGLSLIAWPRDDTRVILYLRVLDIVLNRLILDTAEFISDRDVDGFGIASAAIASGASPSGPVTLYSGEEVAGLMMPVQWDKRTPNILELGTEKIVTR